MDENTKKITESFIENIFTQAVKLAAIDSSIEMQKNIEKESFDISDKKIYYFKKYIKKKYYINKFSSVVYYFNHKFGKMVATVVITLMLSIGTVTAFASVRKIITSLLIAINPEYTQLQLQQKDMNGELIESQSLIVSGSSLPAYMPIGFNLVSFSMKEQMCDAYYRDNSNKEIAFSIYASNMMLNIDSENANQSIEQIGNTEVYIVEKDGAYSASWTQNNNYYILIASAGIVKSEFIKIIDSVN